MAALIGQAPGWRASYDGRPETDDDHPVPALRHSELLGAHDEARGPRRPRPRRAWGILLRHIRGVLIRHSHGRGPTGLSRMHVTAAPVVPHPQPSGAARRRRRTRAGAGRRPCPGEGPRRRPSGRHPRPAAAGGGWVDVALVAALEDGMAGCQLATVEDMAFRGAALRLERPAARPVGRRGEAAAHRDHSLADGPARRMHDMCGRTGPAPKGATGRGRDLGPG